MNAIFQEGLEPWANGNMGAQGVVSCEYDRLVSAVGSIECKVVLKGVNSYQMVLDIRQGKENEGASSKLLEETCNLEEVGATTYGELEVIKFVNNAENMMIQRERVGKYVLVLAIGEDVVGETELHERCVKENQNMAGGDKVHVSVGEGDKVLDVGGRTIIGSANGGPMRRRGRPRKCSKRSLVRGYRKVKGKEKHRGLRQA
ncbi:hypothetical protein VNO78_34318 [Psophocarpus tetragonolobus]|uniref:Uncharacterized protein n=1 Tax=Psophocarpus tetragonolobus TaxID=3891 RepID=A0AAN9NZX3_PSOTE